jgi:hypothetical protein
MSNVLQEDVPASTTSISSKALLLRVAVPLALLSAVNRLTKNLGFGFCHVQILRQCCPGTIQCTDDRRRRA